MKKRFTNIARNIRKRSTETESYLWKYLRDRQLEGFKFRRQQPIGRYIVDFVNFEKGIIVEADGGQHAIHEAKDGVRDSWLKKEGYEVLRFWDNEILNNIKGVLEIIREKLLTPHPNPLPHRGEGKRKS